MIKDCIITDKKPFELWRLFDKKLLIVYSPSLYFDSYLSAFCFMFYLFIYLISLSCKSCATINTFKRHFSFMNTCTMKIESWFSSGEFSTAFDTFIKFCSLLNSKNVRLLVNLKVDSALHLGQWKSSFKNTSCLFVQTTFIRSFVINFEG